MWTVLQTREKGSGSRADREDMCNLKRSKMDEVFSALLSLEARGAFADTTCDNFRTERAEGRARVSRDMHALAWRLGSVN